MPTVAEQPHPELLWWVGCAPATDPRAQKTAQAFARCCRRQAWSTPCWAPRRNAPATRPVGPGNEYLFAELAAANVETLNRVAPRRIVTTCPHCLHTLKNEYPAFGGTFEVIHHTQLIQDLYASGRLKAASAEELSGVAFHDPCYLGRQNGVFEAPRQALEQAGAPAAELPRHGAQSFCCGAGGAQMWKEEEQGAGRVSDERLREAAAAGASTLADGCPFCMIMLTDAAKYRRRDDRRPRRGRDRGGSSAGGQTSDQRLATSG